MKFQPGLPALSAISSFVLSGCGASSGTCVSAGCRRTHAAAPAMEGAGCRIRTLLPGRAVRYVL